MQSAVQTYSMPDDGMAGARRLSAIVLASIASGVAQSKCDENDEGGSAVSTNERDTTSAVGSSCESQFDTETYGSRCVSDVESDVTRIDVAGWHSIGARVSKRLMDIDVFDEGFVTPAMTCYAKSAVPIITETVSGEAHVDIDAWRGVGTRVIKRLADIDFDDSDDDFAHTHLPPWQPGRRAPIPHVDVGAWRCVGARISSRMAAMDGESDDEFTGGTQIRSHIFDSASHADNESEPGSEPSSDDEFWL